jgi:hypothetical protein
MISIAAATGLLDAVTHAGGDPDRVLRIFNVDRSLLAKADGSIPCALFAGILKEAARNTGDDCFGMHFGEQFDPKDIGPLAYVALNSPTIAAGIQNVERYLHAYDSSAKWFFTTEGSRGYLRYVLADLGVTPLRQSNEHGMTMIVNTLRMMVGSQWSPQEVQFAHEAPRNIIESFGPQCCLALKAMLW